MTARGYATTIMTDLEKAGVSVPLTTKQGFTTQDAVTVIVEAAMATAAEPLRAALDQILKLEPEPFVFPADWQQQIDACPECQRYKDHPIQRGICDMHRKPIYERERHDNHQQRTLIYRAQDIARTAVTSGSSTRS